LIASVIPAFLFCLAETKIDSSLAGFLNALTPIFAIITGILFYNSPVKRKKIAGVLIAFCGMLNIIPRQKVQTQRISFMPCW